jgi:alditol oxidase
VPGEPGEHTTLQDGLPAPWHTRLPHFRLEFTPSKGEEIQSEFFVPREHGAAAVRAVRALGERLAPVLLVSEIRTVAADELPASMAYGRDSVALHFTWVQDQAAVEAAVAEVEAALAPYDPRPHWGKVFTMTPQGVPALRRLAAELDPHGIFANDFTEKYL